MRASPRGNVNGPGIVAQRGAAGAATSTGIVSPMARISVTEHGLGEHVDWSLHRPKMAVGMGALSEAVYGNTRLPLREREAARWTIALINDCAVCRDTRAREGAQAGIDEGFYGEIGNWRESTELADRERLAAEFAERFALDHLAMDDAFWARLRDAFGDGEADAVDAAVAGGEDDGVLAPPLIEAAIQQVPLAAAFHQVHGTGDCAGRAPKCEFHHAHGSIANASRNEHAAASSAFSASSPSRVTRPRVSRGRSIRLS